MNVTSSIDVAVDPTTAFTAFTDEIDQWWGNGPIDAWDSSRCIGRRRPPTESLRRPVPEFVAVCGDDERKASVLVDRDRG